MASFYVDHNIDNLYDDDGRVYGHFERVVLDQPEIGRFEFSVQKYRTDFYSTCHIPVNAVYAIGRMRDRIRSTNITLEPANLEHKYIIETILKYLDSKDAVQHTDLKLCYRVPVDLDIAMIIVEKFFDFSDEFEKEAPAVDVVYYYLSVLKLIDHPFINEAFRRLEMAPAKSDDDNRYLAAILPDKAEPNGLQSSESSRLTRKYQTMYKFLQTFDTRDEISSPVSTLYRKTYPVPIYVWYAEVIHFLSALVLPPVRLEDTDDEVSRQFAARNEANTAKLRDAIGAKTVTPSKSVVRGAGWYKIVEFFANSPHFCRTFANAILKPSVERRSLTVLEAEMVQRLKEAWRWSKLRAFHSCLEFATDKANERIFNAIPELADQRKKVIGLYEKLRDEVGDDDLAPFAALLVDDEPFFDGFRVKNYAELWYATVAKMNEDKEDSNWEYFRATRLVDLPRERIDNEIKSKLQVATDEAENPLEYILLECKDTKETDVVEKV